MYQTLDLILTLSYLTIWDQVLLGFHVIYSFLGANLLREMQN